MHVAAGCVGIAAVGWFVMEESVVGPAVLWAVRLGPLVLAAGLVTVFLCLTRRKSKVPEFLRARAKDFFERKGFCFTFEVAARDGQCCVLLWFENRYDRPCRAAVEVNDVCGWRGDKQVDGFVISNIECGPAAFGVARVPFAVPGKHQGEPLTFNVGASVDYPEGRGETLRFRQGLESPSTSRPFGDSPGATRSLGVKKGSEDAVFASWTVTFPKGIPEEPPPDAGIKIATLWKLGDPVPEDGVGSAEFDKRAALLAQE